MAKKLKKFLKKAAKAALIGGALYGGSKLLKGAKGNVSKTAAMEDANIGINTRPQRIYENFAPKKVQNFDPNFLLPGAKDGGRIGAKGGGIAKRGMGAAYKSGGRVKSMGIATRGGRIAKR